MLLDILSSDFHLGKLKLNNRIVMAPMSRNLSPNHRPNQDVASYYQRRASGGVGLIITEACAVDHPAAHGAQAHAGGPRYAPSLTSQTSSSWGNVLRAVKKYSTPIFMQLWHVGSTREPELTENPDVAAYGPSAVIHPKLINQSARVPVAMSKQDIYGYIDAYAKAAKTAMDLGFDGVEINGAHGYGVDQFFWSETNLRNDEYGGQSLLDRSRFAIELIQAIKDATHATFPISFRFSQWKMGNFNHQMIKSLEELKDFVLALSNAGVDIFHVSTRYFDENFLNSNKTLAAHVKEISQKPVIAVGNIATEVDFISSLRQGYPGKLSLSRLNMASEMIANQEIDLLAIGRPLIADAQWYNKVKKNTFDSIIPFSRNMLEHLDS